MLVIDQVFWAAAIVGAAAIVLATLVGVVGHTLLDTGGGHDVGSLDAGSVHALPGDAGVGDVGGVDAGGFDTGDAGAAHAGGTDVGTHGDGGAHGDHGGHADGHWTDAGQMILGYLNPTALAMSLAFFGAVGLVVRSFGMWPIPSVIIAVPTGVALSRFTTRTVGRLIAAGSYSSHTEVRRLMGRTGEVTTAIRAGGVGQISVVMGGSRVYYPARSDREIALGTRVFVERIDCGVAIVSVFGE